MLRLDDRQSDRKRPASSTLRARRSASYLLEERLYLQPQSGLNAFLKDWNYTRSPAISPQPSRLPHVHSQDAIRRPLQPTNRTNAPTKHTSQISAFCGALPFSPAFGQKNVNAPRHRKSKSMPLWQWRGSTHPQMLHGMRQSLPWRIPTMEFEQGDYLLEGQDVVAELCVLSPPREYPISLNSHEEACSDSESEPRVVQNRVSAQRTAYEPRHRSRCTLEELYEKYKSGFSGTYQGVSSIRATS